MLDVGGFAINIAVDTILGIKEGCELVICGFIKKLFKVCNIGVIVFPVGNVIATLINIKTWSSVFLSYLTKSLTAS